MPFTRFANTSTSGSHNDFITALKTAFAQWSNTVLHDEYVASGSTNLVYRITVNSTDAFLRLEITQAANNIRHYLAQNWNTSNKTSTAITGSLGSVTLSLSFPIAIQSFNSTNFKALSCTSSTNSYFLIFISPTITANISTANKFIFWVNSTNATSGSFISINSQDLSLVNGFPNLGFNPMDLTINNPMGNNPVVVNIPLFLSNSGNSSNFTPNLVATLNTDFALTLVSGGTPQGTRLITPQGDYYLLHRGSTNTSSWVLRV